MPDVKNLNDLFVRTLRRIYDAEQRLTKALPKLEKSASSPELKQAFQKHLKETETHVERLDRLFGLFDQKPGADTSESTTSPSRSRASSVAHTGTPRT